MCPGFLCRASRVTHSRVCHVIIRTKVTMAGHAPHRSAHKHMQLYMNTHRMVFGSSKFPAHVFMQPVGHHEESISHWQVWIGLGFRVYFDANMMHSFPGEQRIECWTLWWSHYAQCTWCHTCHQYTSVIMIKVSFKGHLQANHQSCKL
jgi:hypothetical protein